MAQPLCLAIEPRAMSKTNPPNSQTAALSDVEDFEASPRPRSTFRRAMLIGRIVLAAGLLTYVLSKLDWTEVRGYSGQIDWLWGLAFLIITPAMVVMTIAKWRLLLQIRGHHVGFWRLFELFIKGQFFNMLLPSTVGGDVYRTMGVNRDIQAPKLALASVVAERFTGATVLVLFGAAALILSPSVRQDRVLTLMALSGIGLYVTATAAVLHPRVIWLGRVTVGRLRVFVGPLDKLERFQIAMREYRHHGGALVKSLMWSAAFNLSAMVHIYIGCRMLGQDVALWDMALATPIILLVAMVPLTPGGYGVVHWAYFASFTALGVSGTIGASVAILINFKQVLWTSGGYAVCMLMLRRDQHDESASPQSTDGNESARGGVTIQGKR